MDDMELDKQLYNAFNNKRILVTGHTGFKGSWIVCWLLKLNAEITGYSLKPPSCPNMFESLNLKNDINHLIGDIRDIDTLQKCFDQVKPDVVIHMAAQSLVHRSYSDPVITYSTNVMGTVNILECVRKVENVRAVINVTSDKCYENREWIWGYRENDPMGGYDPYSSSKGCSELVTSAYLHSFFNPKSYDLSHKTAIASARAGNVIGGGDWGNNRLIPDCVRALSEGRKIIIRNPKAVRPWQHVIEPINGYLKLCMKLLTKGAKFSGGWNFGPNEQNIWTVEDTVKEFCENWGKGSYEVYPSKIHEASLLKLDSSKSNNFLNWKSQFNTKKSIKLAADWYKAFVNGTEKKEMRTLTEEQIASYN